MTEGCPHCVTLAGSCCLCHSTRRIPADLITTWLWAYDDCDCKACGVLLTMRKDTRPRPTIEKPYRLCKSCEHGPVRCESCRLAAKRESTRQWRLRQKEEPCLQPC
jgi:hypothetical protein